LHPRITLTVPVPDRVGHPDAETDPGRLRARANALPFACPTDAASRMLELIARVNRLPPPVPKRPQVMAALQGAYDRLYRCFLDQTLEGPSGINDKRHARLLAQIGSLSTEMAFGYKLAIQPRRGERHTAPSAETIYQAIRMLETGLLLACAAYLPPPGGVWRELCQIFDQAERLGLTRKPVTDPSWADKDAPDIELLFKRVMLLGLLDPYRLAPGDVWHAHEYLTQWAGRTLLARVTDQRTALHPAMGLIDLAGDQPPRRLSEGPGPEDDHPWRLLDPSGLREPMETQLESLQASDARLPKGFEGLDPVRGARLLQGMAHAWLESWQRSSPRQERYEWMAVACGIRAIVEHLRRRSGGTDLSSDPFDEAQGLGVDEQDGSTGPMLRCQQFDRSAQGIGMRVQLPAPPELTVGQLVLLPSPENRYHESSLLGVVRRMIKRYHSLAEVGIELIDGNIRPAALRPTVFGRSTPADSQPALILATAESTVRGVVITPVNLYRPSRELVLRLGGESMRVAPVRLLESTPGFARFEYRVTMRDIPADL